MNNKRGLMVLCALLKSENLNYWRCRTLRCETFQKAAAALLRISADVLSFVIFNIFIYIFMG